MVSILIPFKNTGAFLPECLQSILEQDYPKWEVLAVDDHSSDASFAIVEQFSLMDPRIQLITNTGVGIIPALRTAYGHSRGELISRMDSDDIMPAKKIRVLAENLLHNGPGNLAVGQVKYFSIRGISNGYQRYEAWLNRLTATGANYTEIYKECPVPSPCWMAFRSDLDACGAFDEDRYPEDYDLCFRFYRAGLSCIPCSTVLHYWRDYDNRTSRVSEKYAQNYFLDIKLHYFLKLDHDARRPLVVWGAGSKGKTIAASLKQQQLPFLWFCDNPKKIGKKIYGVPLVHYSGLEKLPEAQSIITVANPKAQNTIRDYLEAQGQQALTDYFFFC